MVSKQIWLIDYHNSWLIKYIDKGMSEINKAHVNIDYR